MGTVNIQSKEKSYKRMGVDYLWPVAYSQGRLSKLNSRILGLRDIAQPAEQVEAIAAVFGEAINFIGRQFPGSH